MTVQLKQEGDALASRGDYEAAVVKYRTAVNQEPNNIPLRFALGAALSHLDRRQETIEQFQFVVSRGTPDSTEVQAARRWLVSAGELAESTAFAPSRGPGQEPSSAAAAPASTSPPAAVQTVKVKVRTEPRPGSRQVNIVLAREGAGTLAFTNTVKLGEAFEFDNVPPGNYRLTAEDTENDTELWNLQVTVAPGKDLVLDLK